jgi:hypothetical protein
VPLNWYRKYIDRAEHCASCHCLEYDDKNILWINVVEFESELKLLESQLQNLTESSAIDVYAEGNMDISNNMLRFIVFLPSVLVVHLCRVLSQ